MRHSSNRFLYMKLNIPEVAAPFLGDGRWRQLRGQLGGDLSTDDYAELLKVIHSNRVSKGVEHPLWSSAGLIPRRRNP